jgi:hypothetical protein
MLESSLLSPSSRKNLESLRDELERDIAFLHAQEDQINRDGGVAAD